MFDAQGCPCGSGLAYAVCCEPYLSGSERPQTAQQLMRSRYSAFVVRYEDYLLQTWHVSSRPEQLVLESGDNLHWLGLNIIDLEQGGADHKHGIVEFVASFKSAEGKQSLHERSRFIREAGQWFYLDGEIKKDLPARAEKIARNALCPCGSGKKFKRCCAVN